MPYDVKIEIFAATTDARLREQISRRVKTLTDTRALSDVLNEVVREVVAHRMPAWHSSTSSATKAAAPANNGSDDANDRRLQWDGDAEYDEGATRDRYGNCIKEDCKFTATINGKKEEVRYSKSFRDAQSCRCAPPQCEKGGRVCWKAITDASGNMYSRPYALRPIDYKTGECGECPRRCTGGEFCEVGGTRMQDASGNNLLKDENCKCPPPCTSADATTPSKFTQNGQNGVPSMLCNTGRRTYEPGSEFHCECPEKKRMVDAGVTHSCARTTNGVRATNDEILYRSRLTGGTPLTFSEIYGCHPQDNDFAPGKYPAAGEGCECKKEDLANAVNSLDGDNVEITVCGSHSDAGCGTVRKRQLNKYVCTNDWGEEGCRKKSENGKPVNLRHHVHEGGDGSKWSENYSPAVGVQEHKCATSVNNIAIAEGSFNTKWPEGCTPETNDYAPGYYIIDNGQECYCSTYALAQSGGKKFVCSTDTEPDCGKVSQKYTYSCEGAWGGPDCRTKQELGNISSKQNLRRHVYDNEKESRWS